MTSVTWYGGGRCQAAELCALSGLGGLLYPLRLAAPAQAVSFDLVSFFLSVFNPGVFHHKEKILGLWPNSPGIRSRQVNKTTEHFT